MQLEHLSGLSNTGIVYYFKKTPKIQPLPPQIPNSHELPGGFAPQGPPPGAALDPLRTLAVPRPLAYPRRPPNVNSWIRA